MSAATAVMKREATATFCLLGICRVSTTTTGAIVHRISVTVFIIPPPRRVAFILMQVWGKS